MALHSSPFHVLLPAALAALAIGGCGGPQRNVHALNGETMGTTYSAKLANRPAGQDLNKLHAEIDRLLERVNDQMSTYRADSELSRFNRYQRTDWFDVSRDTAIVVDEALRIAGQSGGAFDPTVAPLVDLWHFGPDRGEPIIPDASQIAAARQRVDFHLVTARTETPALKKSRPDVELDLSAIAKGFGVDRVAELLEANRITSYMVEIGGEVRASGTKPDGSPWSIGLIAPRPDPTGIVQSVQRVLPLKNAALATSGDYRNYYEKDGKRYSHTIDPRSGRPVEHELASVTVIGPTCMECDALATTLMVLGPAAGYNFAVEQNIAALFISRRGDEFVERATPGFETLFPQH